MRKFSVNDMHDWIKGTQEFQRVAGVAETSAVELAEDYMTAWELTESEKSVIRKKFSLTSVV